MNQLTSLIAIFLALSSGCKTAVPLPDMKVVPGSFVYSIVEHNDSLYFSTQQGETFRFPRAHPDTVIKIGKKHFFPLRTLQFTKDNRLLASSYETGVQEILDDTSVAQPALYRHAWAMTIDKNNTVWLAGRQGLFRSLHDTLVRVTRLNEVYDVDFYQERLVVAHRNGVTLFDTSTWQAETTYCPGIICWTIDVFDSLLVVGGVGRCLLVTKKHVAVHRLQQKNNIPWSFAFDSNKTLYFATQHGLFRLCHTTSNIECIGYQGKCIKSLLIDSHGVLWVGTYFKP